MGRIARRGGTARLAACTALGAAWLVTWAALGAAAGRAAEPPPFPADPAALARAQALRALPCAEGDAPVDGFMPAAGVPSPWRVAGALVSVRRAGRDRFAFVLDPPRGGALDCAVRDVLVLPPRGEVLACVLADRSSQGIGVHAPSASGRRDLVYWRADGAGGLRRVDLDAAGLESDTGALICALPDAMP